MQQSVLMAVSTMCHLVVVDHINHMQRIKLSVKFHQEIMSMLHRNKLLSHAIAVWTKFQISLVNYLSFETSDIHLLWFTNVYPKSNIVVSYISLELLIQRGFNESLGDRATFVPLLSTGPK